MSISAEGKARSGTKNRNSHKKSSSESWFPRVGLCQLNTGHAGAKQHGHVDAGSLGTNKQEPKTSFWRTLVLSILGSWVLYS